MHIRITVVYVRICVDTYYLQKILPCDGRTFFYKDYAMQLLVHILCIYYTEGSTYHHISHVRLLLRYFHVRRVILAQSACFASIMNVFSKRAIIEAPIRLLTTPLMLMNL